MNANAEIGRCGLKLVNGSEDSAPTPKSQSESQVREVSGESISEDPKTSKDHAHLSDVVGRI
jgi:hypothetical protein